MNLRFKLPNMNITKRECNEYLENLNLTINNVHIICVTVYYDVIVN